MKKLLDGSKMKAAMFFERFTEIVGTPMFEWMKLESVTADNGSESYCHQDSRFMLSGSAYDPPVLWQKTV